MRKRTVATRIALALGVLLLAWAAPAAATDVVGQTSANLEWTPASGSVAGYGVFISRNGGAYPATPNATTPTTDTTVSGAYGDTLVVKVAAYDASGVYGPFSPESDPISFVPAQQPAIGLGVSTLTASAIAGASPASQTFTVANVGSGTLSYAIAESQSWLSVSPASGTSTGETDTITVSYATGALAAGSYNATITVSGGTGVTSRTVSVTLTIDAAPAAPAIALSTSALSASVSQGNDASPLSFTIHNAGGGTLSYGLSDNASWLGVAPATGTSAGESDVITVSFATAGLAAGSYSATITASASGLASQTIGVTLSVNSGSPVIEVSPTSLAVTGVQGIDAPSVTFTVRNAGGGTLNWGVGDFQSWMSQAPITGSSTGEPDVVTVSFQSASRSAGVYSSTISVSAGLAGTVTIPVTLTISQPAPAVIETSVTSLTQSVAAGANAASQSFTVRNAGGGALNWSAFESASWLSISPSAGTSTGEADAVSVSYATSGLAAGTYTAPITFTASGVGNVTVDVTLTVGAAPSLAVSTTSLGASATTGQNAAAQSFSVRNAGGGSLAWSVSESATWLSLSPASGSSSGENDSVSVSFASSGLAAGTYSATITVAGTGVASRTIGVTLTVRAASPPPPTTPPLASLSANKSSPQYSGVPITFTASATGGAAPYQYRWWVFDGTTWTIVQDWTTSAVYVWTPSAPGSAFQVAIHARSAGVTQDGLYGQAAVPFTIQAPPTPVATGLAADKASPEPMGATITFTASSSGGVTPHQYRWWVFDGVTWAVARDWSTDDTFAWTPTVPGAAYQVAYHVRSAGVSSSSAYDQAYVGYVVTDPTLPVANGLVADKPSPQLAGTAITFSAQVSGGIAPYQYRWWLFNGSTWAIVRDWSSASTLSWTPTVPGAGYLVAYHVRSKGVTVDTKYAQDFVPYVVKDPALPSANGLTSDKPSPQTVGTAITFTAQVSGGKAPYQFRWWLFDGATWSLVKNWSTGGTFAWTPGLPGAKYQLAYHVRSAGVTSDTFYDQYALPFVVSTGPPPTRADFDGDDVSEILVRNAANGQLRMWRLTNRTIDSSALVATLSDPNFRLFATGDFNGDRKADLLWRHVTTHGVGVSLMDDATITQGGTAGVVDGTWDVIGTGDADANGIEDVYFRRNTTGEFAVWLMSGTQSVAGASLGVVSPQWATACVADFDADGTADLLTHNPDDGSLALSFVSGTSVKGAAWLSQGTKTRRVAACGDLDGDGRAEIVWNDAGATGTATIWRMNGAQVLGSGSVALGASDRRVAGLADTGGDGNLDLLWLGTDGELGLVQMSGTAAIDNGVITTLPAGTTLQTR